jgi:hypothetical protein
MSDGLFWYRVNKGKLVPIKATPIPANQKFNLAAKA